MASNSGRIYQQIETTADFNDPEVYARLGLGPLLETELDTDSADFIPLTAAKIQSKDNTRMFVVGVMPPAINLTMRLLDRSATIRSLYGAPEEVDLETRDYNETDSDADYTTIPGYKLPPVDGPSSLNINYPIVPPSSGPKPNINVLTQPQVYQAIHDAFVRRFKREPTPNECLILASQSWRETSGNWPNNNPGFIGNYCIGKPECPSHPGAFHASEMNAGGDKGWYNSYDTPEAGADAFLAHATRPPAMQALAQGDVMGYNIALAQNGYYGASVKMYYDRSIGIYSGMAASVGGAGGPKWPYQKLPQAPDSCAFNETIEGYLKRTNARQKGGEVAIFRFNGTSDYNGCELLPRDKSKGPSTGAGKATPAADWQGSGSSNAQQAAEGTASTANTQISGAAAIRKSLEAQQNSTMRAIADALKRMAETPPLRMLVNPESFKVGEEKIISDGNWTRNGPVVEHWGENQPKITASGKVAGFYALDGGSSGAGSAGNSPGLTRTARNYSKSYQNFLSLYFLYRNNGAIYLPEVFSGDGTSKPTNLSIVGSVYIYFDQWLYVGSFDSFNVEESDEKPYSLQYDFSFTVRSAWCLDRQADPQRGYGDASLFGKEMGLVQVYPPLFAGPEGPVSGAVESGMGGDPNAGGVPTTFPSEVEARYNQQALDYEPGTPGPSPNDSPEEKQQWLIRYNNEYLASQGTDVTEALEGRGPGMPPVVEPPTTLNYDEVLHRDAGSSEKMDPSVSAAIDTRQSQQQRSASVARARGSRVPASKPYKPLTEAQFLGRTGGTLVGSRKK